MSRRLLASWQTRPRCKPQNVFRVSVFPKFKESAMEGFFVLVLIGLFLTARLATKNPSASGKAATGIL